MNNTNDSLKRFRLIAVFIISQGGLRPTDKDKLFAAARLNSAEAKALSNLEAMKQKIQEILICESLGVMKVYC